MEFKLREIDDRDKEFIQKSLIENWGSVYVVTRNKLYNASKLPGFIAESDDKQVLGFLTYRTGEDYMEIITLNSFKEKIGLGTSFIEAVIKESISKGFKRIWLITTNDNYPAVRFYQKRGFGVVKIHRDAIEEYRKLKPEIPKFGLSGLQIKDEIEMEMLL
jgi:ribosomal protein S18 acetylase RimI-like enzyme